MLFTTAVDIIHTPSATTFGLDWRDSAIAIERNATAARSGIAGGAPSL
jgi:hypothetical protein